MSQYPASDAELLRRWQMGDVAALETLLGRHEGPVFRFLYGLLHDYHAAEDALQETFIQVLGSGDRLPADNLGSWLMTVAYRQAMLWRRRQYRFPAALDEENALLLPDPGPPPDEVVAQADTAAMLRQLVAQLPPRQQEAIVARFYHGLKFREMAAAWNCPLNTVLSRLHAAIHKLRSLWEERHADGRHPA